MLTSVRIKNFQTHTDSTLEFCPGVNIVAGTSDAGKSSIYRALAWILTNKPQGLAFRHWDCEKGDLVSVELHTSDCSVFRRRSETVNEYLLGDKKFVAMKSDVPSDILEQLQISAINLQSQHQPHFLLSSSSGDVAKALNEACDLTIIDTTIKKISSIAAEAKADAKAAVHNVEGLQDKLEDLEWVPEAAKKLESTQAEVERILDKKQAREELDVLLLSVLTCDFQIKEKQELCSELAQPLEALVDQFTALDEKVQHRKSMSSVLDQLEVVQQGLVRITIMDGVKLNSCQDLVDSITEKRKAYGALDCLLTNLRHSSQESFEAEIEFTTLKNEFEELLKQAGTCPLCGHLVGS